MPSLLQKAAAVPIGRAKQGLLYTVPIDELVDLVNAWAAGTITNVQVYSALAPDSKLKVKGSAGDGLVLLAVKRIVASGGRIEGPLDTEARPATPDAPRALPAKGGTSSLSTEINCPWPQTRRG